MTTPHVYQIYIRADIRTVWQALIDPEFTRQYFHATAFVEPPVAGQPFTTVLPDGSPAIDGVIEVVDEPHRFVHTWHIRYSDELGAEPPGRVEWLLEEVGPELTRLRLKHGDLAFSPLTWAAVKDGWVWILDGLKTLLETGTPLPPVSADRPGRGQPSAEAVDQDWHLRQAVEANNATWDVLRSGGSAATDAIRGAYAAAYHWERARGFRPENEVRALYLIGKAWLAAGHPEQALDYAGRMLAECTTHAIDDFDLAYAHELQARALHATGRTDEARAAWSAAVSTPVSDAEDRAIVTADFADFTP